METFVLSIIGADRVGLVAALAAIVEEHDGRWERSQITELDGLVAGLVQISIPEEAAINFQASLSPLHDDGLLDLTISARPERAPEEHRTVTFELAAADRPGILREVSTLLGARSIGMVELRTWTTPAETAGVTMFHAVGRVRLPPWSGPEEIAMIFEGVGDDLELDVVAE